MSKHIVDNILAERASAWEQAKSVLDGAEAEGRSLSAEETEKFNRINADIDRLDEQRATVEAAEKRAREADEARSKFAAPQVEKAAQVVSDEDKIRSLANGDVKALTFSLAERRDLTTSTASGAVPTGFIPRLYEHLIENSAIRQAGATVLTTAGGENLDIPKTTAHSTAAIVTEGGSISESDPTLSSVTLGAFKYGFITQVSRELVEDVGVDLVGYLARQGGRALGNGSGAHFVTGSGTSQPRGVVTAATVGKTGTSGVAGVFDGDDLIDLFYSVIAPYRNNGSWMLSDSGIAEARKLKDSQNQYLWQPALSAGSPDMLLGRPVFSDTNVADPALSAKSVVFGDLSAYYIRDVAAVRVERSDEFAFDTDVITFRFLMRTDGDLVDETGSVKVFQGNAA